MHEQVPSKAISDFMLDYVELSQRYYNYIYLTEELMICDNLAGNASGASVRPPLG